MPDNLDLVLPHLRSFQAYQGVDPMEALAEKAGVAPDKIIKLNGNENPYGHSIRVAEAIAAYPHYNLYPDPGQKRLREALSNYLDVDPDRIVAGNGSDEIIDLIMRMYVGPGDKIIDPNPTFGMYSVCAKICGGEVVTVPRDESFEIDIEQTKVAIDGRTKAIFTASPNNPTGNVAPVWQVKELLEAGILVVVDETYYEFCGETALPLLDEYPNLIVLRTFSKWAGLAGLRIGFGIMDPEVASLMMGVKPPYNVNLAAEVALLASLDDLDTLQGRVRSIVAERERLMTALKAIPGIEPCPSKANFILFRTPEGRGREVFESLSSKGIFLRYFSTERLKDYVRTSVGLPHENDAVIQGLKDIFGVGKE